MKEQFENIPDDPELTGSSKEQKKAKDRIETLPEKSSNTGIGQYPLTETIKNISNSGVRTNAAIQLLMQSVHSIEQDKNFTRGELKQKESELKEMRQKYYEMKENYAVLKERLSNFKERNLFKD